MQRNVNRNVSRKPSWLSVAGIGPQKHLLKLPLQNFFWNCRIIIYRLSLPLPLLRYLCATRPVKPDEDPDHYTMQEKRLCSGAPLLRGVHYLYSRLPALARMAVAALRFGLARRGAAALVVSRQSVVVADDVGVRCQVLTLPTWSAQQRKNGTLQERLCRT